MCGLVAIISRRYAGFNAKQLDMFETMLVLDTLRGKDSTGVMCVKSTGSVDVMKQAEQPYYMFRTDHWTSFRQRAVQTGRILAGHNRAATRGVVTNENAHPFHEKNIVLMHNGTLTHGWEKLTTTKVDVDSHAICHAMTEGTPQEVLPKLDGAFALLWYDLATERFYATRNDERPLNLITTADFYFLASESWMATIPCMREHIKVESSEPIAEGDILSWDLKGNMQVEHVKLPMSADNQNYQAWLARQGYHGWEDALEDKLGEPAPGKNLALPGTRKHHQVETKDCGSDKACALTTTTKQCSNTNSSDSAEESLSKLEQMQSSLKVDLFNLPKGKEVLVKIFQIQTQPNGAKKWFGKLMEPGCEMIDATGFLDRNIPGAEWPSWMESWVTGKVAWVTKTSCGLTVSIADQIKCSQTMVHHGKMIPTSLWIKAHNECTCRDCKGKVYNWQKEWTSVKTKGEFGKTSSGVPLNVIEMVCPDCIMKSLEGEFYAKYSNSYYQKRKAIQASGANEGSDPAVQDREQISGEPVGKNGSTIAVPGPSTLQ